MHSSYYVEKVDIPVDHSHTNSIIEFIETGARHNILLVLFSIYLVLAGLFSLIFVFDETGSLKDATSILYGIASILAGVSFILIKELPRNFGFITLAIFLLLDGINVERIAINNSDYPLYYFTLIGIIALVSGVFFGFQRGTWKNFGFIMLSGYPITTGAAGMCVYDTTINHAFLLISVIFSLPAAVSFFLRR